MWIVLVGGLMITLPATVVILFSLGTVPMIPALCSLAINMLPFIAAYFLMRKQAKNGGGVDLEHVWCTPRTLPKHPSERRIGKARMAVNLSGKTAVVTGSSKGIGYAIAEAFAAAGANVVVCARDATQVAEAARKLDGRGGGRVVGTVCDLRSYEDVKGLVSRAIDEFGQLDILINNAGIGHFAPIEDLTVEQWAQTIETNLSGVFYACREAIPHMKRAGSGWIINIASLAGKNPFAGGSAYNASKFGLVGFSEAMMLDVRNYGIRVNYIMPGSVATYFNDHTPTEADAWKIQPEDIAELVMGLMAMPERTLPSRIEVRPSRPPKK